MRRLLAILMVVTFSLPLGAPLLAQDVDSHLPACCRRGGMHHCMGDALAEGTRFSAMPMRCPLCPKSVAPVRGGDHLSLQASSLLQGMAAHRASAVAADVTRAFVTTQQAHLQRGPPALTV